MSSVLEIERAIERLPAGQKKLLLNHLAGRLKQVVRTPRTRKGGLKAALRPPIVGLPEDLSEGTRDRVKLLIARRHATNR